jgi:hypothetical protein
MSVITGRISQLTQAPIKLTYDFKRNVITFTQIYDNEIAVVAIEARPDALNQLQTFLDEIRSATEAVAK